MNINSSDNFVSNIKSIVAQVLNDMGLSKKIYKIGYIDPNYVSGKPKVYFDGEQIVNLTNLVSNGNFSTTSNWTTNSTSSFSVSSNTATFLATAQYGNIVQSLSFIAGHKYYVSCKVKSTGSGNIGIALNDGTWFNAGNSVINGNYNQYSLIGTAVNTTGSGILQINDQRASGWTAINVQNVVVVDLTSVYGTGNEPTQVNMDNIINNLNGFFSGSKIVFLNGIPLTKQYSYLSSYVPVANDRVLLLSVAGSYVILGKIINS